MINHGVCEGLCALAASGHIADTDREALALHCLQCRLCRDHLSELAFVGAQLLVHAEPSFRMSDGSLERFRARATREGIAMRRLIAGAWMSYGLCSALAMVMLFFMVRSALPRPIPQVSVQSAMPTFIAANRHKPREAVVRPAAARAMPKKRPRTLQMRPLPVQNASFPVTFALRYPFIKKAETGMPVFDASYPALSSVEMKRLGLFRNTKEPAPSEPFGVAALECPSAASATGCSFDFADNIRQLHFQIPNVP